MKAISAYVYAAIAAAVLAFVVSWHLSRVHAAEKVVHAHYAGVLAGIKEKTAEAAAAYRATEDQWRKSIEGIAKDGQDKLDTARRDAAGARSAADSLRKTLNRFRTATSTTPNTSPTGTSPGKQDSSALDLLANVLTKHSQELVAVGSYADQLAAAGGTCERSYDALNAVTSPVGSLPDLTHSP